MKRYLLIGILIVHFGCKKSEEKAIAYPISINFTTIAKGENFYINSNIRNGSTNEITNQGDWQILLKKLDSISYNSNNFLYSRSINFSTNQLLVLIDSLRPTLDWSIDVTDVKEYQNNIEVKFKNIDTNNDATAICRPYNIVQIPIQTKTIIFKR